MDAVGSPGRILRSPGGCRFRPMARVDIDALYTEFADSLGEPLRTEARNLAHRLALTPIPGVPWSEVFQHRVTLAAPELAAEAMPGVRAEWVQAATLAHMLAVIEAFGTDRVADGQIEPSLTLEALLARARRVRAGALEMLGTDRDGFDDANRVSRAAIAEEHALLATAEPIDLVRYQKVSLGKQAVGFPASLALGCAAGLDEGQLWTLRRLLADVWLGLQYHDNVVDWEDDWRGGGAWAVSLARGRQTTGSPREPATEPNILRSFVLRSGVLADMLELARRRFRGARKRAQALGARTLEHWALAREHELGRLVTDERASAGFAVRERRLMALRREAFG